MTSVAVTIDGRPVRYPLAGVGQYVFHLARELAARQHGQAEIRVLLLDGLRDQNAEADELARLAPRAVRRGSLPREIFNAWSRWLPFPMPRRLAGGRTDVWHQTYFEAHPRLRATKLVATIHDVIFLTHPQLFPRQNLAASRRSLSHVIEEASALIAVSDYTRRMLVEEAGVEPGRVVVVPNAVDVRSVAAGNAALLRERRGIRRPYALYVGNLEPRKDIPTLARAWAMSRASSTHELVLAGAPAYLSESSTAAIGTLADECDVKWLGYVSEAEKAALFEGASVFIYPSIYEGFGIPVLEALAYGVPVVACDTSSIPEVAGDGALLVAPSQPEEMASAIDSILVDASLADRLSTAGRAHAASYSWTRTAAETATVYESVCA